MPSVEEFWQLYDRFDKDRRRVFNLFAAASGLKLDDATLGLRKQILADLFRMGVVFLHATLEEFLRSLSVYMIDHATPKFLNELAGNKKFGLGELASHRAKTVDQILREFLEEYLSSRSFSKPNQVAAWLADFGIIINFSEYGDAIGELMERRHRIVHSGDIDNGDLDWTPEDEAAFRRWYAALNAFITQVLFDVAPVGADIRRAEMMKTAASARWLEVKTGSPTVIEMISYDSTSCGG